MGKSGIICATLLLMILSFLPIRAVSPDVQYMDETIPQYDFYERVETEKESKITDAIYHCCLSSGITFEVCCKVNLETREVFDIEIVDVDGYDLEILESEYIEFNGYQFAVFPQDELAENHNSYWRA